MLDCICVVCRWHNLAVKETPFEKSYVNKGLVMDKNEIENDRMIKGDGN